MANEFHDLNFDCVGASLVPSGPGYATDAGNFVCSVRSSFFIYAFLLPLSLFQSDS